MTTLSSLINRGTNPAAIPTTGSGAFVLQDNPTINDGIYNGSQSSALGIMTGAGIDCSTGIRFVYAMAGDATFVPSNIPSGFYGLSLKISPYTSGVADWSGFTNLKWVNGAAPVFTPTYVYEITFSTDDAGANWTGSHGEHF